MRRCRWSVMAMLVWLPLLSCNRGQPRAVIGVVFTYSLAVQVAQAVIAETARAGEPVILLQHDHRVMLSTDQIFRRAEWALALPDLVAVVGHESSGSSLTAATLYHDAGVPLIVPTATTPLLEERHGTFPLAPNDSIQGAFLAQFAAHQLDARRASVFFVTDEYGWGLRLGVVQEFVRLGVEVIDEVPIDASSNVDAMAAASLARGKPDVIVAAARYPEAWDLARAVQARARDVQILAGDGADRMPDALQRAGAAADSVYLSVFWHPDVADSSGQAFIQRFQLLTGLQPSSADALVYDAIMVSVAAIRAVGPDRRRVTRYLEELGAGRPSYQGVTGEIDFRPTRSRPILMIQPYQGETHVVYQP
ncbi:MAG: ABC transporter substrate-binding protein [Gemmatimonadetes bacterium]|nr:ABC transporter substrate-binding protein [Gemmatimonadota bacterium]